MKHYELTFLLKPVEESESLLKDIVNLIKDNEGEVESTSEIKNIEMGSPINPKLGSETITEVLMGTIGFYFQPEKANALDKKISEKRDVLRTMILAKKEETMEPQEESEEEKKVELEDIDQKLDEILDSS